MYHQRFWVTNMLTHILSRPRTIHIIKHDENDEYISYINCINDMLYLPTADLQQYATHPRCSRLSYFHKLVSKSDINIEYVSLHLGNNFVYQSPPPKR